MKIKWDSKYVGLSALLLVLVVGSGLAVYWNLPSSEENVIAKMPRDFLAYSEIHKDVDIISDIEWLTNESAWNQMDAKPKPLTRRHAPLVQLGRIFKYTPREKRQPWVQAYRRWISTPISEQEQIKTSFREYSKKPRKEQLAFRFKAWKWSRLTPQRRSLVEGRFELFKKMSEPDRKKLIERAIASRIANQKH